MASKNSSNNVFNVSKEASDLATDDKVQEEERRQQEQGPTLLVANPTAVGVTVAPDGDTSHYQSSDDISDTSAQVLMISMSVFSVIVLIVIVTGCSIGNT